MRNGTLLIAVMSGIYCLLSGCASGSASIKPAYISHEKHNDKSCSDLRKEYEKTSEKAASLGRELDSSATKDKAVVAGAILAPVALVGLAFTGGGKVDQDYYAQLLGEKAAIEKAAATSNCKL